MGILQDEIPTLGRAPLSLVHFGEAKAKAREAIPLAGLALALL